MHTGILIVIEYRCLVIKHPILVTKTNIIHPGLENHEYLAWVF